MEATALEKIRAGKLKQTQKLISKEPGGEIPQEEDLDNIGFKAAIFVVGLIILMISAGSDLLDYFIIGSIPIAADILDIITWLIIAAWVFIMGLKRPPAVLASGLIELIPFGDFIPTWVALTAAILIWNFSKTAQKIGKKTSLLYLKQ